MISVAFIIVLLGCNSSSLLYRWTHSVEDDEIENVKVTRTLPNEVEISSSTILDDVISKVELNLLLFKDIEDTTTRVYGFNIKLLCSTTNELVSLYPTNEFLSVYSIYLPNSEQYLTVDGEVIKLSYVVSEKSSGSICCVMNKPILSESSSAFYVISPEAIQKLSRANSITGELHLSKGSAKIECSNDNLECFKQFIMDQVK
jgi:hypothetical protein